MADTLTTGQEAAAPSAVKTRAVTVVVHSGDLDKLMAAMIIANGAAAMGRQVCLFFTFWGLNALKTGRRAPGKTLIQRMMSWFMPSSPAKVPSSRMNLLGFGPRLFRSLMRRNGVPSLADLIETAQELDVTFIACCMSMDLMGIHASELIEGIEYGGVATYLAAAQDADTNLFI